MLGLGAIGQFAIGQVDTAVLAEIITADKWFAQLSTPPRFKRGLRASAQQFTAFNPLPVVPFAWFAELSKPSVLTRRGLPRALMPSFVTDPTVIPTGRGIPWFASLSEPVRYKVGLKASLQQFYAGPSRLLPTPNLSGALSVLETKDTFLGGAVLFNRPTDAEIGVINTTPQPAEVGISAAAPGAGVITVKISIIVG